MSKNLKNVQIASGAHPATYLAPRLRMSGSIPLLPLCAFMAQIREKTFHYPFIKPEIASYHCTGLDRPRGLQKVQASRILRQSEHEGSKVVGPMDQPIGNPARHLLDCSAMPQPTELQSNFPQSPQIENRVVSWPPKEECTKLTHIISKFWIYWALQSGQFYISWKI